MSNQAPKVILSKSDHIMRVLSDLVGGGTPDPADLEHPDFDGEVDEAAIEEERAQIEREGMWIIPVQPSNTAKR